jgi:hypothetical protein
MKRLLSTLNLIIIFQLAGHSQNTFPATGNVGIGTATPAFPLDVKRLWSTSGFNAAGSFNSEQTTASTGNVTGLSGYAKTTHSSGSVAVAIGLSGNGEHNGTGVATSIRGVQSGGILSGAGNVTEWICFNGGFGRSGTGIVTNGYGLYISAFPSGVTNKYGVYINDVTAKNYFAGNVCIGTTNPGTFKLAVEGKIAAREIKVTLQNPFPDYVFDKSYNLLSISSLEGYIKQHNHLPGIPSAKEVEVNNGFELGQMNNKLLEKIEELTLYVIELKKENEKIKQEVRKLSFKK